MQSRSGVLSYIVIISQLQNIYCLEISLWSVICNAFQCCEAPMFQAVTQVDKVCCTTILTGLSDWRYYRWRGRWKQGGARVGSVTSQQLMTSAEDLSARHFISDMLTKHSVDNLATLLFWKQGSLMSAWSGRLGFIWIFASTVDDKEECWSVTE